MYPGINTAAQTRYSHYESDVNSSTYCIIYLQLINSFECIFSRKNGYVKILRQATTILKQHKKKATTIIFKIAADLV